MGKHKRESKSASPAITATTAESGTVTLLGTALSWAGLLALLLAVFVVYAPAMRGSYVWDDDQYVNNLVYEKPDALRRIWIAPETAQYYPLAYTAFYLQKKLWGGSSTGFHLVNVLFHFLNAVLVWIILKKLRIPGAGFAAAVFALHPVHVESVAWISELKNVLSGFFYFLALANWLDYEEKGEKRSYWAALGFFLPALLTKTITCTLPAAFVVVRWYRGRKLDWEFVQRTAPFLALGAAAAASTVAFELGHAGDSGTELSLSFAQRVIVAGEALWFYAAKLLWPYRLVFNYVRWHPDAANPWQWFWPLGAVAAGAGAWLLRERAGRGPAAAFAFFAVSLFPALGFFYIYPQRYSYVADHFQYLSTIAPAAVFAAVLAGLLSWDAPPTPERPRWTGALPALAVLVVLAGLSWRQARTYRSSAVLWQSVLLHNPASFLAHNNLGMEYAAVGQTDVAMDHYRRALAVNPNFAESHNNLGLALLNSGKPAEAEEHFRAALRIVPGMAGAHNNLGLVMAARGRPEEALKLYRRALDHRPGYALAYYNIGNVFASQGKMELAEQNFRLAIEEWPDYSDAHVNLANVMAERGDTTQAIVEYQRALRAKPRQPFAHNNLANALMSLGRRDEAVEQYRLALALNPDFAEALNNLGNAMAESGRLEEAATLYRRALAAQPGFKAASDNLNRIQASQAKRQ